MGPAHVMGCFTESPKGNGDNLGLHLVVSTDGLQWMPPNRNDPHPTLSTGTLRAPPSSCGSGRHMHRDGNRPDGNGWIQQRQYIHVPRGNQKCTASQLRAQNWYFTEQP
ncbi:hypothetical protein AB0D91_40020 [Streptomyces canus]|uniref:hypothetical protein n=1 Tax=Streptomyces canus TaxID=58343 RepID=UPI0033E12776